LGINGDDVKLFIINNKKKFIFLSVFAMVLIIVLTVFAWLLKEDTINDAGISNFVSDGDVYFIADENRVEVSDFVTGGLLKVNLYNTSAQNFIGNLRFDVKHKGFSPCYLRVRILEQWIDDKSQEIMQGDNIPYIVGNDWYDNRLKDLCFYYNQLLSSYEDNTQQEATIPLITGIDGYTGSDTGVSLFLTFKVETVQPNRFKTFWGIDQLPWQN
jgi:hypothetical protein